MRVLLPLKKKLDDPNSSESTIHDESFDSETGEYFDEEEEEEEEEEYLETTGEAEVAGTEEESTEDESSPESPTAKYTGDTAAPLRTSSTDTSADTQPSPQPATASALAAGQSSTVGDAGTKFDFNGSSGHAAKANDPQTNQSHQPKETGPTAQGQLSPSFESDKKDKPKEDTNEGTPSPEANSSVLRSSVNLPPLSIARSSPAPLVAKPPTVSSSPGGSAAPSTTTRARKRRSPSPLSSLDTKPPCKKAKDTKLPARDLPKEKKANLPATGTSSSKSMAGGSRGGRQLWSGSSPSYFVETASNGREDVSSGEDGAEVDVRFAYRHDNNNNNNDPESTTRSAAPPASRTPVQMAARVSRNNNHKTSNSIFHHDGGRDDADVRDRDLISERPDGEDHLFAMALKKQGLEIVEQEGDGNCLFRAISLQVYGDASMHGEVRHRCLEFMARDKEHFSQFITDEPFEQYIRRKRQDGVHGNNPEIQAISELFNRPIEVFVPENGATPLNIFHAEYKTQDAPIRLSYHDGNHYNAVIDPLVPTAGLGLGLPGLQPGLADKMQMAKAVAESDRLADQREFERALEESNNDQLQRAIKESTLSVDTMYQYKALSLSDCDATNFELEQAVLESSLESFRTFEHGRKQASSSSSGGVGRRKRQAGPAQQKRASQGAVNSAVASIPNEARQDTVSGPIPRAASAVAAAAAVAEAPPVASRPSNEDNSHAAAAAPMMAEYYPQTVQELVMNGFELRRVVHAYDLVGDNFDDLLSFLMSNGGP